MAIGKYFVQLGYTNHTCAQTIHFLKRRVKFIFCSSVDRAPCIKPSDGGDTAMLAKGASSPMSE